MQVPNALKNRHLLWRAGFGPTAENAGESDILSHENLWEQLLTSSDKAPQKIEVAIGTFDGLIKGMRDPTGLQKLSAEQKKAIRQRYRQDIKNLNLAWTHEMINSEAQFREKMSLFWHGHFACRIVNIFYQQQLLDVVRSNALGGFGDLLKAVSKTPAMLQFLNNQQNRKQHPNENFAREVMELFTMGRGNYSENDVKEAARSFTGWNFTLGEFVFRDNQHDDGIKTFLGKTGNFNGDDIIDIILEQKQTAVYVTKKIYCYFVNESVDEKRLAWLADRFYKNEYNIKKLMSDIFTSHWFYDEENIGTKIKSPVELLVGIRRLLPMELTNNSVQLLFQRALGQILFYPPNVAGWPGGKSWIDSSTLMLRLRIPQIITANERIDIRPKADDDIMMGQMTDIGANSPDSIAYGKRIIAEVDWQKLIKIFEKLSRENLLPKISETVLQARTGVSDSVLNKYINKDSRENFIKTAIIYLMSTPEYQLC